MADQIEETIRSLRSLGHPDADPGKVIRRVRADSERRRADGDHAYLGDLGIALLACRQAEPRAWQYPHTFDHLFRLLVGESGGGDLTQTLRLITASRDAGHDIDRLAAALVAENQRGTALAAAIYGSGDDTTGDVATGNDTTADGTTADGTTADGTTDVGTTFRACLVHELVLREGTLARRPQIAAWAASEAMRHHPLGRLPLELAGFEQDWSRGRGDVPEPDREIMVAAGAQPLWPATDVTTDALAEALSSAVLNWAEDSNGEIEARVFDLAKPVTPATVPDALAALDLACLEPGTIPFRLSVFDISAHAAWWILFHAALDGSAYGRGRYGAYSRLFAWRSLAALAGAPEDAGLEEVAALAQQCAWYRFDAESSWYTHVFWDIGLVAVRSGGRGLAVLAATDTD